MFDYYKYTQTEEKKLFDSITILVDTREQVNDHITNFFDSKKIPWKKTTLGFGDYSFYVPKNDELGIPRDLYFDKEIMVERKASLDELAGNVTKERDRIKKELALAPPNKILVIENGSYADMVNGNYRSEYSSKSYYGTVHSFWHEFNMPIIFMPDNKLTGLFIVGYFKYYLRNKIKH